MGTALVAAAALSLSPPALVAKAVAANEALYRDIDVTYRAEYRLTSPAWLGAAKLEKGGLAGGVPTARDTAGRLVRQGGLYRFTAVQRSRNGPGESRTRVFGSADDGEKTWTRQGDTTSAEDGRRPPPREAYFPHLWATGPWLETFPLSVFLAGGPAWDRFPDRARPFQAYPLVTRLVATDEVVAGERCVVARCRLDAPDGRGGFRDHWLAVGKNYLPVQTAKYEPTYSAELAIEVVEAADFRELRPGQWLPFRLTRTVYDEIDLRDHHRAVVSNTTTTTVTRAALNPNHDPAFFRDLRVDGE
jgi:hypothetical protein